MQSSVKTSLARLHVYLERLERDLAAGERTQALSDCAEIAEISRRLWSQLEQSSING